MNITCARLVTERRFESPSLDIYIRHRSTPKDQENKMALRLCPRALSMRLNPARTSRPFTSLCKSPPRPRIPLFQQPLNRPVLGYVSRRQFWGIKKETTESMGKAGKNFAQIFLRATLYGGAFIIVGIAGFFIYDVLIPFSQMRGLTGVSRKHIIPGDNPMTLKSRFWQ